jgi:hypothetical protein
VDKMVYEAILNEKNIYPLFCPHPGQSSVPRYPTIQIGVAKPIYVILLQVDFHPKNISSQKLHLLNNRWWWRFNKLFQSFFNG